MGHASAKKIKLVEKHDCREKRHEELKTFKVAKGDCLVPQIYEANQPLGK